MSVVLLASAVMTLCVGMWTRRYLANRDATAQAERRKELHRALALTHDLEKRGATGFDRGRHDR